MRANALMTKSIKMINDVSIFFFLCSEVNLGGVSFKTTLKSRLQLS